MPNSTSLSKLAPMLFLMISPLACASFQPVSPPQLANRTLRLSSEKPGFEYQYEVCLKSFLGICTSKIFRKDFYDLNDPLVRQKLIDMGFVARVREQVVQP